MNDLGGAPSASVSSPPATVSFARGARDHTMDDGSGLGASHRRGGLRAAAVLGVLGVVYGDIGTSPLYAFKASLTHFTNNGSFGSFEVLGILSLIFWSLILIVTIKYVLLVMRADNRGEGGILALMALAQRSAVGLHVRRALLTVGIVGACLFFGDGVITPAISVLSAVEGLEVSSPQLARYVLPAVGGHHRAAVRAAMARHRQGRHGVRAGDGGVVRRDRAAGRDPGVPQSGRAERAVAGSRHRPVRALQGLGVRGARLGRARGDRGRGVVRRHGAFRGAADPRGLARVRAASAGAELFRPRRPWCWPRRRRSATRSTSRPRTRSSCRW